MDRRNRIRWCNNCDSYYDGKHHSICPCHNKDKEVK